MKKAEKELLGMTVALVMIVVLAVTAKALLLKIVLDVLLGISIPFWSSIAVVLVMKVTEKLIDALFNGMGALLEYLK